MDVGQVAVAKDAGVGVTLSTRDQEAEEGGFLGGRAGVGRTAVGGQATLVADAE